MADASIEEVLDDLQLYQAILQSLDEQRPDAAEERQETLDVISNLKARLADLQGTNTDSSHHRIPSSPPHTTQLDLPRAQLDGGGDLEEMNSTNLPRWGHLTLPPPSPRPQLGLASPRKRERDDNEYDGYGYDSEFTDDLELPFPKRGKPDSFPGRIAQSAIRQQRERLSNGDDRLEAHHITSEDRINPGAEPDIPSGRRLSSSRASPRENSDNEFDDFLHMFDPDTFRALQDEQREAERWLQEKREQERRDEEYARYIMRTFDQPRPSSARSSSSTQYSGSSLPLNTLPSPVTRVDSRNAYNHSTLPFRASAGTRIAGMNPMASSHANPGPQPSSKTPFRDSDDSDITEITPGDFQRVTGNNSRGLKRDRHENQGPFLGGSAFFGWDDGTTVDFNAHRPFGTHYSSLGAASGPSGLYVSPNFHHHNNMARLNTGKQLLEHVGKSGFGEYSGPNSSYSTPIHVYPSSSGYGANKSMGYPTDFYDDGADPKLLNQEIKQLLETIRPDADVSQENREGTPEALKFTLLEHQKLGLSWMKSKEEQEQKGGILADDMGLGKTIQAISLIVSRPSTDPERKTTLIIAPVALMQQWKREIERCLKPGRHQLSVYVLHGEKRSASFRDLNGYDVVLTTFGTLSSELKRRAKYDELLSSNADEPTLTRNYLKSLPCLGPTSRWYRVIIDEAQCIKNRNTKAALACCRLDTIYRWCMSGTPMMNSVEELHSLLQFLRIRPYCSLEPFNRDFTRPLKSTSARVQEKAMTQLRVLLKAVLLRRTKDSKIDGKPILELPSRISEKVHAVFSDDELELYTSLETQTQLQFNKYLESGTVGRNYTNILVLLLRLRQACCHPHLISDFSVKLNANTDELDLVENAKAFSDEVVNRLKDNSDLECPICIDAVDNPIIFFPCGHGACAECFSRISDPSLSLQQGIDGAMEVKCPNCRGRVDPKQITDHLSFRKVHFPDSSDISSTLEIPQPTAQDQDEDDGDEDSDDDDSESLSSFIANDSEEGEPAPRRSKGKGKMTKRPKKTLAELKKEASRNQASKRQYLRRLEKTWITSAKIDKTMEILRDIQLAEAQEKTIIFSQFTSLLDLLEVPIARDGWRYRRYDGSMKPADRNSAVLDFTDDPDCRIMLVSLKAGNSGLNLVAASQVILFDPFWNPYIEEQAIDRAHRIGQMRQVQIHRILVENTVEDRILELQEKKRELIEGALDEKASKNISRLSTRELAYLFGIRN